MYDFYYGSNYEIARAEEYLAEYGHLSSELKDDLFMGRDDFAVEFGEAYATIEIPVIDLKLPIIYGTEMEHLRHGIGHDPSTWFPGDGNQIFLSGHNDSAFLQIGKLEKGDTIVIRTAYGKYEYEVDYTEIGDETETWRVGETEEETLVLMTCYPFFSLTRPSERYFVYAAPVE